jgi:hypothetical protein
MNLDFRRPAFRRVLALALALTAVPAGVAVAHADPLLPDGSLVTTTSPTTTSTILADCADFVHVPPCPDPTSTTRRTTTRMTTTTTILADCWDFVHTPPCPPRPTTTTTIRLPGLPAWLLWLLRWLFGIPA